jgi:alpha-methylacyl-CoA racemase
MPTRPLSGIRILDLSRLLPGPFCTMLLADVGAEVIKVEDVNGGDTIRGMAPFLGGESAYFLALNAGKKSLALNLKSPRGVDVFLRLVRSSQVVVESFRPGTVDRLGVGYGACRSVNPAVVYCSISGYGQDGPLRDRAGHDLNYIARAGILDLSGRRGELPVIPPVQIADLSSAMYAATAILAALRGAEQSGEGRYLDISMLDSALSWLIMTVAEFSAGETAERGAQQLTGKYPCYNIYRTKDGAEITLAALEAKFWLEFCKAAGRPDLAGLQYSEDPDAAAEVAEVFASRTRDEWSRLIAQGDFCAEFVRPLEEALLDAQVHRRGLVRRTAAGGETGIELVNPLRFVEKAEGGEPPEHGGDTFAVLKGIGYAEAELAALEAEGIVLGRRP